MNGREFQAGGVECCYIAKHTDFHVPHPDVREGKGKLVCLICHPPASHLRQLEKERNGQATR